MRCLTPRFQTIAEAVSKLPCRMESLELNSKDLRELPLTDRRQHLNKLLARTETVIYPVPSFDNGQELLVSAMDLGFEGVVSKLKHAPYRSGYRPEWVKIKAPGWAAQNRDRWEKLRG